MKFLVFQLIPIVSSLATDHHWENSDSVIFFLDQQVLIPMDKVPSGLLFSKLGSPSSLSFSLILSGSSSLCWTHFSMSLSVSYWGTQHWDKHSRFINSSAEHKRRTSSLILLAVLCLMQPSGLLAALLQGNIDGSCSALAQQDLQGVPYKAAFQAVGSQVCEGFSSPGSGL